MRIVSMLFVLFMLSVNSLGLTAILPMADQLKA